MMDYKKYLFNLIGLIVAILVAIALFVYTLDPFQQFRGSDKFIGNQRLEIGGVARHHDYDAIVTGSSMAMNHYPSHIDSLFGWRSMNFSIMGATFDDYDIMLRHVISAGKVKHIILGLDFFSFARARSSINPYLYNDRYSDLYKYIYNYTTLENCINKIKAPLEKDNLYHFNSPLKGESLWDDYEEAVNSGKIYKNENFDYELMKKLFDETILNIVEQSDKSIDWKIYFPPYSITEFMLYQDRGSWEYIKKFKSYIINALLKYKNVSLYDFQQPQWIERLDQYMDLRHHSHYYNKRIIENIHSDSLRLTSTNTAAFANTLDSLILVHRRHN